MKTQSNNDRKIGNNNFTSNSDYNNYKNCENGPNAMNTISRKISTTKQSSEEFLLEQKYIKFIKFVEVNHDNIYVPFDLCLSDEIYSNPLICVSCNNIAAEAKMCIECEDLYCNLCIRKITRDFNESECINCHKKLRLKNLNKLISNLLNNLILCCPSNYDFENNKLRQVKVCRDIVVYRDILEHLRICSHYEKFAECVNCKFPGRYSSVLNHLKEMRCNDYLQGSLIYEKKISEKYFKTQNIPSKQEYELINKIQSPRMIQENFDRLIILKEKQVSEYKDDPLLLDNKVIKTLIEKIQSQENIFDIFKDECEKNFKQMNSLLSQKDEAIKILSENLQILENKFMDNKNLIIEQDKNLNEYQKEIREKDFQNNKIIENKFSEIISSTNESFDKFSKEIQQIKSYEEEIQKEIYNCSEIRNMRKLKSIQNYCIYSDFEKKSEINIHSKSNLVNNLIKHNDVNYHKHNISNNTFFSTGISENIDRTTKVNFNEKAENKIVKSSKLIGHTDAISHIIQIKSKNPEKQIRRTKFKIASSSFDTTIKLWDFDSNKCLGTITGHVGGVYCIRQIRDFEKEKKKKCKLHKFYLKKLISCGFDQIIRLWNLKDFSCLKIFEGHRNIVESIVQIKDKIYSCSHDKEIKIWSLKIDKEGTSASEKKIDLDYYNISETQKPTIEKDLMIKDHWNKFYLGNLKGHTDIIKCLQKIRLQNKSNKYFLLSGAHDHLITIWDVKSKVVLKSLIGHEHCVNSITKVKWDYDDYTIASGSLDKTIKLWNLKNFECFLTIKAHDDCVNKLIFLKWKNKENIIVSCSDDKTIKLWSIEYDNKKKENFETKLIKKLKFNDNANYVNTLKQIRWSRDETTILSGGKDSQLTIWS